MRFANPAAWLGLVLLALPVAVHMLVRHHAPLERLPTLRFLRGEPPVSIRRSRPDEPLLLLLRMVILALAVAALARPHLPTAESPNGPTSLLASTQPNRAVLVDESWSMLRPLAASDSANSVLGRAHAVAAEADAEARASTVIPFGPDLPLEVALEGAAAWLAARPGPGEIVLVSDFQRGTLRAANGVALPERLGLVPMVVEVDTEGATPIPLLIRDGSVQASVEVIQNGGDQSGGVGGDVGPDAVRLTWSRTPEAGASPTATALGPPAPEVELIFPGPRGDSPRAPATVSPSTLSPGAASLLLRVASDRTLAAAAAEVQGQTGSAPPGPRAEPEGDLIVTRDRVGHALLTAGATPASGLRVASRVPSESLTAAALRVAVDRASHSGPPGEELEPRFDDAEFRASWARTPSPGAAEGSETTSSRAATWAWILVLVLLVGESLFRRRIHAHRN